MRGMFEDAIPSITKGQPAWIRPYEALILLLLLTLFIWMPLTYPGTFLPHTGFLSAYNLQDLETRPLADLVGWAPVVGREFDLWRGEGSLPYLLARLLRSLGAGATAAVEWVYGLGLVLSAWGMWLWARRLLGERGGLLAAVVYSFWPFALATVYVRGALAEALLLALLPWLFWTLESSLASPSDAHFRWIPTVLTSVLLIALYRTQAGLALWATLLAALYVGWAKGVSSRRRWQALGGMTVGILLGLLSLWPVYTAHSVGNTSVQFGEHFLYAYQLLDPGWGYGVSTAGWQDDFPFGLGVAALGLALLAVVLGAMMKNPSVSIFGRGDRSEDRPQGKLPGAFSRAGRLRLALAIVMALTLLTWHGIAFLWRLPGLAQAARTLTYPWQLLLLVGPFLAFLAGAAVPKLEQLMERQAADRAFFPLWAGLAALTVLASYGYLSPRFTQVEPGRAPVAVLGENQIVLVNAQVNGQLTAGGTVTVTVQWQPLQPLPLDYTVFVHAVDEQDQLWGQQDTQPRNGEYPTSQWQVGEIVDDTYRFQIQPDGPAGGYRITIGMYDWRTGERLRVGDDNRIFLPVSATSKLSPGVVQERASELKLGLAVLLHIGREVGS